MQNQILLENSIHSQWVAVQGIYLALLCFFNYYYFVEFKQGHLLEEK